MDVREYNKAAWDRLAAAGDRWTLPVSPEAIAEARAGRWEVVLTPQRPVPRAWFGTIAGARVLGLASAGGQQGPILAAAGARVVVFDNSPAQLERDRTVAAREGLALEVAEGDMKDLSRFEDGSFDLVFHPCSNCFVEAVRPVWNECARVLRPGGLLLAGFSNPIVFAIDRAQEKEGRYVLRHRIPYSDLTSISEEERLRIADPGEPLAFGHTLEDQIGGQIDAGFSITGFFEDGNRDGLADILPAYIATRAVRT